MPKLDYKPPQDSKHIELTREEYEQSHGWNLRTPFQRDMAGSFQPFADAYKDLKNTFKSYKGWYQSNDDLFQPIYGVGNLLLSAWATTLTGLVIGFSPLVLLIAVGILTYNVIFSDNRKESNQKLADFLLRYLKVGLVLGPMFAVSHALRGITQLAFTPLTWLIKMPLRGLITLIEGRPKMEASESVQRLVKMGNEVLANLPENEEGMVDLNQTTMPAIIKALLIKLRHSHEKEKSTNLTVSEIRDANKKLTKIANSWCYKADNGYKDIPLHELEIRWKPVSKNDLHNCLTLFSPKNNEYIESDKVALEKIQTNLQNNI